MWPSLFRVFACLRVRFACCVLQVLEPMLILGKERFAGVDIRIRVRGGGHTSQIYAVRQALCKVCALVSALLLPAAYVARTECI